MAQTKKQAVFELLKDGEWHASPEVRKAGGDNPSRYVREIRAEIRAGKLYGFRDLLSERDGATTRYRMVRSLSKSPPRGGIKPPEPKSNGKLNPRAISREQKLEVEKAALESQLEEARRANAQLRARLIKGDLDPDAVDALKATNALMLDVASVLVNEHENKALARTINKQVTRNEKVLK
jgi:hypothetical protein